MLFAFVALALTTDPFEIQVYEADADRAGHAGLELHVNDVAAGVKTKNGTELAPDGQTHFTLEPSFGVTDWWELGAYFQTALAEGQFHYAGVKLRSKFIAPGPADGMRVGVNFELSWLPPEFDRGRYGAEIRPIFQWSNENWLIAVNPIVDLSFGGVPSIAGPTFEPCAKLLKVIPGKAQMGLEYYGNWGPISKPLSFEQAEHYVFEVVNVIAWRGVELNLGVGEGLSKASNPVVFKMIVGYSWE